MRVCSLFQTQTGIASVAVFLRFLLLGFFFSSLNKKPNIFITFTRRDSVLCQSFMMIMMTSQWIFFILSFITSTCDSPHRRSCKKNSIFRIDSLEMWLSSYFILLMIMKDVQWNVYFTLHLYKNKDFSIS